MGCGVLGSGVPLNLRDLRMVALMLLQGPTEFTICHAFESSDFKRGFLIRRHLISKYMPILERRGERERERERERGGARARTVALCHLV